MEAIANTFDPDQTRAKPGNFSSAYSDAASAAFKSSAKAARKGTKEAHAKAAAKHTEAAGRATSEGNPDMAQMHAGMAQGHKNFIPAAASDPANAASCAAPAVLPNSSVELILDNATEMDDEGWALIAPYGEHPKTRRFLENGLNCEQKYIQVLDNESADQMMSKENSFFGTLKRAIIGIPVYKGHGDLKDVDPKALSNEAKIKIGIVDKIRKGVRGIEAHFALDNEGAEAVAQGCKLPSALWMVMPIANAMARAGDAIRCRPFKLISVALTRFPNISGVESLANAGIEPIEQTQKENMQLHDTIVGLLIGKGIVLPNEATDEQLTEILANGDYMGHEFHGNQYTGGEAHGAENEASRKAHIASSKSDDKESHQAAAHAHARAAALHEKAGNSEAAAAHQQMAQYHANMAAKLKK